MALLCQVGGDGLSPSSSCLVMPPGFLHTTAQSYQAKELLHVDPASSHIPGLFCSQDDLFQWAFQSKGLQVCAAPSQAKHKGGNISLMS